MTDILALGNLGIGSVLAVFVILLWRNDQKNWGSQFREDRDKVEARLIESRRESDERYIATRRESEERYAELAKDFREIITANTKALTEVQTILARGYCPYAEELTRQGLARGSVHIKHE